MVSITEEKINGKRYIVARNDKGTILEKQLLKEDITTLRNRFKENGTFEENKKVDRLKKLTEVTIYKDTKTPPTRTAQYVVEGTYKGVKLTARSQKIGEKLTPTPSVAIERARINFYRLLSQEISGGYDEAEGKENIDKVKNLREGWVYYV
jgi:hypothetical protein